MEKIILKMTFIRIHLNAKISHDIHATLKYVLGEGPQMFFFVF